MFGDVKCNKTKRFNPQFLVYFCRFSEVKGEKLWKI